MGETILQNLQFLLVTFALLGIVFVILVLVGRKKNLEFRDHKEELLANHKLGPRDIVLLQDGRRVTLVEPLDDGARFAAETLPDYGRQPDKLTIGRDEIVKIEYYAKP